MVEAPERRLEERPAADIDFSPGERGRPRVRGELKLTSTAPRVRAGFVYKVMTEFLQERVLTIIQFRRREACSNRNATGCIPPRPDGPLIAATCRCRMLLK